MIHMTPKEAYDAIQKRQKSYYKKPLGLIVISFSILAYLIYIYITFCSNYISIILIYICVYIERERLLRPAKVCFQLYLYFFKFRINCDSFSES